jgi:hypothetical protein
LAFAAGKWMLETLLIEPLGVKMDAAPCADGARLLSLLAGALPTPPTPLSTPEMPLNTEATLAEDALRDRGPGEEGEEL